LFISLFVCLQREVLFSHFYSARTFDLEKYYIFWQEISFVKNLRSVIFGGIFGRLFRSRDKATTGHRFSGCPVVFGKSAAGAGVNELRRRKTTQPKPGGYGGSDIF